MTPDQAKLWAEIETHTPSMLRIIGVLSNSDDFAESYKCKVGTFMNPDPKDRKKCSVW